KVSECSRESLPQLYSKTSRADTTGCRPSTLYGRLFYASSRAAASRRSRDASPWLPLVRQPIAIRQLGRTMSILDESRWPCLSLLSLVRSVHFLQVPCGARDVPLHIHVFREPLWSQSGI